MNTINQCGIDLERGGGSFPGGRQKERNAQSTGIHRAIPTHRRRCSAIGTLYLC